MDEFNFNDGIIRQITVDENNVVQACSIGGFIEGGIDVEDIPESVLMYPLKWCYKDSEFVLNENYRAIILNDTKTIKIAESKQMLAEWLANHPYLYSDGKYYACTEEKQALLNGNLASYERAKAVGIEYPLKWNSTGEECTEWTYNNLLTLSLSIAAYVAPKVSTQQSIELQIKACETVEQLNEIVINYGE